MKKILTAFFLLALVSCSRHEEPLKQTRDDQTFTVVLNIVDENRIKNTCAALGVEYTADGCNAFDPTTKVCTIYVMPQRFSEDKDRLAIVGHELWHCRYGSWHE